MKIFASLSLSVSAFALFVSFATPAGATTPEEIAILRRALSAPSANPSQRAVFKALAAYGSSLKMCEIALTRVSDSNLAAAALDEAPTWLLQTATDAFLNDVVLSPEIIQRLNLHEFLTQVEVKIAPTRERLNEQIVTLVKRGILDTNPLAEDMPHAIWVKVSDLQIDQAGGHNSFSLRLSLTYDNGQNQDLQFTDAPIETLQPENAVSRLIVAAIHHRRVLSSPDNLRKEINVLGFNIKKLVRISDPAYQITLGGLINDLDAAQPKAKVFGNLLGGNRKSLGGAFLTLFTTKERLLEMSQTALSRQARGSNRNQTDQINYVARSSSVARSGPFSAGYYVATPGRASTIRGGSGRVALQTNSETNSLSFYAWMMDPGFMLSHPWFWGVSDQSFMAPWMMMSVFSDISNRNNAQIMAPPAAPYTQNQMDYYTNPVAPVYTANLATPVIDPWNANALSDVSQVITPSFANDGSVNWTNADGASVDPHFISDSDLGSRWQALTGQNYDPSADRAAQTTDDSAGKNVDLSNPDVRARFESGNDGSGFNSQSPSSSERVDSIKSSQ